MSYWRHVVSLERHLPLVNVLTLTSLGSMNQTSHSPNINWTSCSATGDVMWKYCRGTGGEPAGESENDGLEITVVL